MNLTTYNLDPWKQLLEKATQTWQEINFLERLLKKDFTLWKEKDQEISSRLGWIDSPLRMQPLLDTYHSEAEKLKAAGINLLVLLGMGGSSLAPEALSKIIGPQPGFPALLMLDSTSPSAVQRVAQLTAKNPQKTLFIVSSKSGTTTETLSFLNYFYHQQKEISGTEAGRYFMAITDPGTPLENLAKQLGFSQIIRGFPEVGGRFSALSPFGLFPAALMGFDLKKFLEPAVESYQLLKAGSDLHPGLTLGATLGCLAQAGQDKLTLIIPSAFMSLGRWLEQLIAESTGKEGRGILPVIESLPLSEDSYSPDRLFVFYELESEPNAFWRQKLESFKKHGWPLIHLSGQKEELAGHFYLWELATAAAGYFLKINPFDQPDVELTKEKTKKILQSKESRFSTATLPKIGEGNFLTELKTFLERRGPKTGYLALLCFLTPDDNLEVALNNLARQLSEKYHLPCIWNYGPAYLHSTGQLYKGDSGQGMFISLMADDPVEAPIPSLPESPALAASFKQLFIAQALADFEALREKGRRILSIRLADNPVESIFILSEVVRNQYRPA